MADYILSCCSTADLSKEHFDSREIHYICFHFMLDGVDYPTIWAYPSRLTSSTAAWRKVPTPAPVR